MKITLQMSVNKLLEDFEREFGVMLGIYKGAKKSNDIKLLEISDPRKNPKAYINVNKDTMVGSLETMFKENFGIRVQIKDMDGNTIDQESMLGGIRNLEKGYANNGFNIEVADTDGKESKDGKKEKISDESEEKISSHPKGKKSYFLNSKKLPEYTVEDRIKEIDRNYLNFQKSEKYKYMIKLLSSIEEAKLLYPDYEKLKNHIEDIKNKSCSISDLSIKKRRFAISILIIITSALFIIGAGTWAINLYGKFKMETELDNIVKEIDSLRIRKGSLLESGNVAEASAIDQSIDSKSKRLDNIQTLASRASVNYFLIITFIMIVFISILVVRLNRYNVTSVRFKKDI